MLGLCYSYIPSGGGLGFKSCISATNGLTRTGRDHGNEMMDETAIRLRLDRELNTGPSGWKPNALPLS